MTNKASQKAGGPNRDALGRCCIDRVMIPRNRSGNKIVAAFGGRRKAGEEFEMLARFKNGPSPCGCRCCEYRQYVRGTFKIDGKSRKHKLAAGFMSPGTYREDTAMTKGGVVRYGHRHPDGNRSGDEYSLPRGHGCEYLGWDFPGIAALAGTAFEIDLHFKAEIRDVCTGQVVTARYWHVHYSGRL